MTIESWYCTKLLIAIRNILKCRKCSSSSSFLMQMEHSISNRDWERKKKPRETAIEWKIHRKSSMYTKRIEENIFMNEKNLNSKNPMHAYRSLNSCWILNVSHIKFLNIAFVRFTFRLRWQKFNFYRFNSRCAGTWLNGYCKHKIHWLQKTIGCRLCKFISLLTTHN